MTRALSRIIHTWLWSICRLYFSCWVPRAVTMPSPPSSAPWQHRSIVEWHGIDYSLITWVKSRENHLMFITYNQQYGFQTRKYTYLIKSSRLQLWLQYQYNAVQSSMIILSWLRRNINQWLSSQLTPLISTSRVSYGVSIVGIFLEKNGLIIMSSHCILSFNVV